MHSQCMTDALARPCMQHTETGSSLAQVLFSKVEHGRAGHPCIHEHVHAKQSSLNFLYMGHCLIYVLTSELAILIMS